LCGLVRHLVADRRGFQAARPAKLTGPAEVSVQHPGRAGSM